QLCVHYNPEILPLARIREVVERTGARITERFGHALWKVEGIGHERRARTVTEGLRALPGVFEAQASAAGLVRVEFDRNQTSETVVLAALGRMGIAPARSAAAPARAHADEHVGHDHGRATHGDGDEGHAHRHGGALGPNAELIFSLVSGGFLALGFAIEELSAAAPAWVPIACYVVAYVFGGFFTVREAIDNLRLKKFEIDTLMLVAAAGAATLGAWAEG